MTNCREDGGPSYCCGRARGRGSDGRDWLLPGGPLVLMWAHLVLHYWSVLAHSTARDRPEDLFSPSLPLVDQPPASQCPWVSPFRCLLIRIWSQQRRHTGTFLQTKVKIIGVEMLLFPHIVLPPLTSILLCGCWYRRQSLKTKGWWTVRCEEVKVVRKFEEMGMCLSEAFKRHFIVRPSAVLFKDVVDLGRSEIIR